MESRIVQCVDCAAQLRLPEGFAAQRFRCSHCGALNSLDLPAVPVSPEPDVEKRPDAPPPPSTASSARTAGFDGLGQTMSANKSRLRPLRWLFLLAILPLALEVFYAKSAALDPAKVQAAFNEQLNARLAGKPELRARIEKLGGAPSLELLRAWADAFDDPEFKEEIGKIQPEFDASGEANRREAVEELKSQFMEAHCGLLPPPLLARDSWGHWGVAGLSALLFLSYFCFAYPRGNARVGQLLGVGLFTGTIGIVLLLAVQFLAELASGFQVMGNGLLTFVWLILRALDYSYSAADNPANGFFLSFIGFTLGVGLLEELCKQLPLIWRFRRGGDLDWRGACVWGLASGAGFGVSEGIMYSQRYYNGSASLEVYLVRFISCVAMHAAWAGSAAILLHRRQRALRGRMAKFDWVKVLAPVLIGPMVLHGLYDTLLKREMAPWALLAAAASFVFFIWLQEREARDEIGRSMHLMGPRR